MFSSILYYLKDYTKIEHEPPFLSDNAGSL